jgi:membrane-bound serine protease (ClpP class)
VFSRFATWIALMAAAGALASAPASATQRSPGAAVVHVRIDGPLDVGTQSLLSRGIRRAKDENVGLLVELDTPGGEIELMWRLATMLDQASRDGVTTTAWINDKALSAGALLAIACDRIYMSAHGVIGASMPVTTGPEGMIQEIPDSGVREKITAAARSSFHAFAQKRNRPPALAEAMVDRDVEVRQVRIGGQTKLITGSEWDDAREKGEAPELVATIVQRGKLLALSADRALELGMIDGVADKLEQVLEKLGLHDVRVIAIPRANSEDLAALLDRYKYLLLVIGIVAAYAEFKAPGFGVAGIISIVSFALFLFGQYLLGLADVWQILAVAGGLVLIALEIFVLTGAIWPGLVGTLLVVGGLIAIAVGPGFHWDYALDRQRLIDEALRLLFGACVSIVLALVISRFLPQTPGVRRMVLAPAAGGHTAGAVPESGALDAKSAAPGALGLALTDLRPVGKVALDVQPGREFEARSSGTAIDRGARVRVVEVASGRIVVELESSPSA